MVAAIFALFLLKLAEKPPDEDHVYGHTKAEYFPSIIEAGLILLAAVSIGYTAFERIANPRVIEQVPLGLFISVVASIINLVVAIILLRVGKEHKSVTLEADGHHLLTDVWTSVGVISGVVIVSVTGLHILDPIIAILVAVNIIVTGYKIMRQSAMGLMILHCRTKIFNESRMFWRSMNTKGLLTTVYFPAIPPLIVPVQGLLMALDMLLEVV